jgi:hypothetical protein
MWHNNSLTSFNSFNCFFWDNGSHRIKIGKLQNKSQNLLRPSSSYKSLRSTSTTLINWVKPNWSLVIKAIINLLIKTFRKTRFLIWICLWRRVLKVLLWKHFTRKQVLLWAWLRMLIWIYLENSSDLHGTYYLFHDLFVLRLVILL